MAQRPVQMAFPSGDILRRSATPRIETNFGGRGLQVTPASTITESVLPDPSFADVMARTAAARQARALQQQRQMQQQQTSGPFLPARPEGMPGISPRGRGALAGALAGLQYAGPQAQPTSFAQGLGVMGQAAVEAFTQAKQDEAASEMAERKLALDRMRLGTERLRAEAALQPKPKVTTAMANAEAMGLTRGTDEYNDFINRSVEAGGTQIFMGGDKQKELAYKAALDTRGVMQKQVGQDRELAARLQTVIDLLNSGVETGRVTSAMLPLKQIGRELGFLTDEQSQNLSELEIIDAAGAFLTPRMRVVGSGASSDRDMNFFQRATVRMANTAEANLVIATMQKQVMDYNKRRLDLFDDYVEQKGHDFGFGKFADEKQGSIYQRVATDDDFTKMIKDGQIKAGDVFFNALDGVNEFQIYDPSEMG